MNSPFLLIVGVLACIVRFYISGIPEDNLIMIMALINIVALDYVILILFQDAKKNIIEKLSKNNYTEKMTKTANTKMNILYFFLYVIIFALFNYIYFFHLRSASWNDSISIMALVISISSDRLSIHIGNIIYKIL